MSGGIEIDRFVDSLATAELSDYRSVNMYLCPIRRDNLRRWFRSFDDTSRSAIFVGEAPGVDGARITGVPFTSPAMFSHRQPELWDAIGSEIAYQIPDGEDAAQKEPTATAFWRRIGRYFGGLPRPLTWNAYPFWPEPGSGRSNRTPGRSDIEFGRRWLLSIFEMYSESLVVAVGKKAEEALTSVGVAHRHVRHPSFGGVPEFEVGVERVADELRNRS